MTKEIKVGDSVIVNGVVNSMTFDYNLGTVIKKDKRDFLRYGVEFDFRHSTLHDCGGEGKDKHCYNIPEKNIVSDGDMVGWLVDGFSV